MHHLGTQRRRHHFAAFRVVGLREEAYSRGRDLSPGCNPARIFLEGGPGCRLESLRHGRGRRALQQAVGRPLAQGRRQDGDIRSPEDKEGKNDP